MIENTVAIDQECLENIETNINNKTYVFNNKVCDDVNTIAYAAVSSCLTRIIEIINVKYDVSHTVKFYNSMRISLDDREPVYFVVDTRRSGDLRYSSTLVVDLSWSGMSNIVEFLIKSDIFYRLQYNDLEEINTLWLSIVNQSNIVKVSEIIDPRFNTFDYYSHYSKKTRHMREYSEEKIDGISIPIDDVAGILDEESYTIRTLLGNNNINTNDDSILLSDLKRVVSKYSKKRIPVEPLKKRFGNSVYIPDKTLDITELEELVTDILEVNSRKPIRQLSYRRRVFLDLFQANNITLDNVFTTNMSELIYSNKDSSAVYTYLNKDLLAVITMMFPELMYHSHMLEYNDCKIVLVNYIRLFKDLYSKEEIVNITKEDIEEKLFRGVLSLRQFDNSIFKFISSIYPDMKITDLPNIANDEITDDMISGMMNKAKTKLSKLELLKALQDIIDD